jgi:hypothetical protein
MKATTLRTTVSADVNRRFVARCRELNMSKSEVLRHLIHSFLMDAHPLMGETSAAAESRPDVTKAPLDEKPKSADPVAPEGLPPVPCAPSSHPAQDIAIKEKRLTIFGREYVLTAT